METKNEMGQPTNMRDMLSASGYADEAIDYFLNQPHMGTLEDANQVTELTGPCGDTMKIFLKIHDLIIEKAKIQVLGCPAAVASAMAAMEMITGMNLKMAYDLKDGDVFRLLGDLPDQKQHCVRLTVKTLRKAIEEYSAAHDLNIAQKQ